MTVNPQANFSRPVPPLKAALSLMAIAAAGLAASAIYVRDETIRAERDYPSTGKFMTVRGVRLHFIDTGGIEPVLVLLHGNGAMVADMEISGLVGEAAKRYRVIVFDRPGYGYSERPRDRAWGPKDQADLFRQAFAQLGLVRPLVFGHSWGTQVAVTLALDHPDSVGGLVLASGYYFPTPRADGIMAAPASIAPHGFTFDRAALGAGGIPQNVRSATGAPAILCRISGRPYAAPASDEGQFSGDRANGPRGGRIGGALPWTATAGEHPGRRWRPDRRPRASINSSSCHDRTKRATGPAGPWAYDPLLRDRSGGARYR
jgi:pimeloyl-ACP methyl ester carboxylesterase